MKLALLKIFFLCSFSIVTNAVFLLYRRFAYRLLGKLRSPLKMWKTQSLLVHLVLLVCLLKIYFLTAPRVHLKPQKTLPEMGVKSPANRLVVFLAEGLRAETVFAHNFSRMPHLGELYRRAGMLGISHSRVPTLTEPGIVALFAGFHPEPALFITQTYDTIFNRTMNSADGIVLKFEGHNPKTGSGLSEFRDLLADNTALNRIRDKARVLILVYMGDVGGASPLDKIYLKRLHIAQRDVLEAYNMMESRFKDGRTAYLMTSTHGLTNLGSHGAGTSYETETPFLLWGAGINGNMSLQRLEQIQLAPLMSALIGLPPPVNSLGQLPLGFLKLSRKDEGKAVHLNALQLLLQAKVLIRSHERGVFHKWLPKAQDLDLLRISHYEHQMKRLTELGWSDKAMETSQLAVSLALKAVKYYVGYYHILLVLTTALALLGWQFYLLLKLSRDSQACKEHRRGFLTCTTIVLATVGVLLGELAFVQGLTVLTSICLVVPFALWCLALAELPRKGPYIPEVIIHLFCIVIPAGLIVLTLCCSYFLSLAYVLSVAVYNQKSWVHPSPKAMGWLLLIFLLSVFLGTMPRMEILMVPNYRIALQATSMLLVILRPYMFGETHPMRVWLVNGGILILGGVGIFLKETDRPVPIYILAANWTYLIYAFTSIPYSGNTCLQSRLELICFNLLTVHALLSDSYTSLLAQGLILEYQLGMDVHLEARTAVKDEEETLLRSTDHIQLCYRFAVSIILYFYLSLMFTGHWLHSFTYLANTDRLFMPHSCLAMSGLLIFIHFLIPIVIIMASLRALSTFARHEISSIFICIMLICNAVVLFFVLFVPKLTDWPRVHPSVIKVVLVQLTPVLLMFFDSFGYFLFRGFNLITSPTPKRAVVEILPKVIESSSSSFTSSEV